MLHQQECGYKVEELNFLASTICMVQRSKAKLKFKRLTDSGFWSWEYYRNAFLENALKLLCQRFNNSQSKCVNGCCFIPV